MPVSVPISSSQTRVFERAGRPVWQDRTLLSLYALTGFTGLLAEQGFEKYTALLVGATASASAVVLFTYFLGFALGGVSAGRLIRGRRITRPLLWYGIVELLVGISCVVFSYSFHGVVNGLTPLETLFAGTAPRFAVRFLFGCILILPTAALMGASFPLVATALDKGDPSGKRRWAQAYTANLAGALMAAATAPLILMPALGLRGSLWLCFGITSLVCAAASRLHVAPVRQPASRSTAGTQPDPKSVGLLLAAAFASGAIFFALEVVWTHLVGIVIGCSVYAFSWMLTAVLLGLLIGAWLVNRKQRRGQLPSPSRLFQGAAFLLLLQTYLWDRVPIFFTIGPPAAFQGSFYFAELYKLLVTCLLLVPSSTVLGLIYPILLSRPELEGDGNSHLSGYLSASNSLGCLTGALAGVFAAIPFVGSELTLKLIALALIAFWLLFLRHEGPAPSRLRLGVAGALFAALVVGTLHWNWAPLTSGTGNYYGQKRLPSMPAAPGVKYSTQFIFRDESVQGGMTTVVLLKTQTPRETTEVRTLLTNGKFEGDDDAIHGQMNAQFGFSAIPSLFVNHFDRVLLIGLGTGHTAAALRHLGYGQIDVAEFAPGIVAAARQSFSHLNEGIIDDPHVHLYLEDGRNVLLTSPRAGYDLITIEITSVWFAGATNLYSQEFYELARQRLKPDGVLQQWIQLHHISPREVACALATASTVFRHVGLWFYGNQGMIVASDRPLVFDEARRPDLERRFRSASLVDELRASVLVSPGSLARLMNDFRPAINTDHNRRIEYLTPRYQPSSFDWMGYNFNLFSQYRN
jgi:spermidine synthase